MAVVISGTNNSDKITATDGLIDLLSSVNFASEVSVPSFKVGSDIQIGNAGIITATTLVGNVQGNINHTSNLLLQISGSEKFRVGTSGQLGIGGANYGTSGQVLTSGGSSSAATWSTISGTTINNNANNRIITGSGTANTLEAETSLEWNGTDTLTVVHPSSYPDFKVRTSAGGGSFEMFSCGNGPFRISSSGTSPNSSADELVIGNGSNNRGLTILGGTSNIYFGDSSDNDIGKLEYDHSDNSMRFTTNTTERLRITSTGSVGIGEDAPVAKVHIAGSNYVSVGGGGFDSNVVLAITRNFATGHSAGLALNSGTNATSFIHLGDADDPDIGKITYDHANNSMSFTSNAAERLRITSDGKVGVNVSSFTSGNSKESIMQIKAPTGYAALGIGATNMGITFGWDGDRSAYDDIRMYRVDYGNAATYGIAGNNPTFVITPTTAPGSGFGQETVWLKSTGRGSGNNEMNLCVDGDVAIGGSGQENGVAISGYPGSIQHGLGVSKLTIQPDDRTTAFSASDGDTWHDVIIKQRGGAQTNAAGIAFQVADQNYHKNAGTGIAAVKNGTNSDYGSDLVFITRPQSAVAAERVRITANGILQQSATGGDNQFVSTRTGATYSNGDYYFQLFAKNNSSTTMGALGIVRDTGNTNSRMMFYTADGGTNKERARIHRWGGLQLRNIIPPYGSSEPASRYIYSFHRSGTYNTFWVEIKFNTPGSYCLDLRMGGYSNRHMHYTFQGYVYDGNDFASAAAIDSGNGPQRYYSNQGSAGGGSYGTIIRFGFSSMSATHPVVHYELSYGAAGGDSLAEITNMLWS